MTTDDTTYRAGDLSARVDEILAGASRRLLEATTVPGERATLPLAPRLPEPGVLELASPFAGESRSAESPSNRRHRVVAEEAKDGERRVATLNVDGRSVTTEAVRASGKIQDIRIFNPESKEGIHIVRDATSGKLKIDGPIDADSMKTLTKLGVKVGADGSIKGEIELTAKGELKYTDQPGNPKRIVTTLNPDGTSSKVDMSKYVRTEFDAKGKESATLAWNGQRWAPVQKGDISEPKVSPDGTTSTTSVKFRNPDGSVAKTVDRTVGTADGDKRNLATFTYPDGSKKTYDWDHTKRRDDRTGKETGKDAFGRYSENTNDWARTLSDGSKEYRKDGCIVTKDAERRFTSIATADQPGAPGKRLNVKYDAHGDVNTVTIGGKTYERVGPEKNPGLARDLGRGEREGAFKTSEKFNRWKCKEDGTTKDFNIGITESGKVMIKHPGEKCKDYDLSKGATKDKTAALTAVEKDLANVQDLKRVAEKPLIEPALLSGLSKLGKGLLDVTKSPIAVLSELTTQERDALTKSLEAIAKKAVGMATSEGDLAKGLLKLATGSARNPLNLITPAEAKAISSVLRRVVSGKK